MGVPDVWKNVTSTPGYPGCTGGNVRYLMGHEHCNQNRLVSDGRGGVQGGYLIGASGAGWGPVPDGPREKANRCPYIGFVFLDSTGGRERSTLFTVWSNTSDHYEGLIECFNTVGIGNCTHLGTQWTDRPLPKIQ